MCLWLALGAFVTGVAVGAVAAWWINEIYSPPLPVARPDGLYPDTLLETLTTGTSEPITYRELRVSGDKGGNHWDST